MLRLQTRTTIAVVGVLMLVILLIGVAVVALTSRVLFDAVDADLRSGAAVQVTKLGTDDSENCEVARLGDDDGTGERPGFVIIDTKEGAQCTSSDAAAIFDLSPDERALTGEETSVRTVNAGGAQYRVLARAIPVGYVRVVRSVEQEQQLVRRVAAGVAGIGMLAMVLCSVLVARSVRRSLRPVATLSHEINEISGLEEDRRVSVPPSDDEIAHVAERVNELVDRLEHAERTRQAMLADASHELRTPITALRTNLEVLQAEIQQTDDVHGFTELINDATRQAEELSVLVADLVHVTQAGHSADDFVWINVGEVLQQTAIDLRRPRLTILIESADLVLWGPPQLFRQAIRAVCENAALHGGRDGRPVSVQLSASVGQLLVSDDGAGLEGDPSSYPALLERFGRSLDARSRPGSGLGLAAVLRFAELCGGSVALSDAQEGGAHVKLLLPGLVSVETLGALSGSIQDSGRIVVVVSPHEGSPS